MNSNALGNIDSINHFEDYYKKAKECGMKAIAITEHGNVFNWVKKKQVAEKYGLKYIHAVEIYITESLQEKVRGNYHTCLYALNYDGVKEINTLMSNEVAYNRSDGHFYYDPRITMDEFEKISDNIAVTSACLGGVLNSGNEKLIERYISYFQKNKHRCYLEVQPHLVEDQQKYNDKLYKISQKTGIPLIAGTDTHALNAEYGEGRIVLQKAKKIHYANEDEWDLTFKDYNELTRCFKKQGVLSEPVYIEAIQNTNKLAGQVETFEFDYSHKYPKLYEDSESTFKEKIIAGIKEKGKTSKKYKDRVKKEFKAYKKTGTIDYILLEEDIADFCHKNNIHRGYGRGSVSGSLIAYLLKITDMDSVAHKLIFERFINPERVSLPDIDTDYSPRQRKLVKNYLYEKEGLYCAEIITFNTIELKGAIRDVGRALEIPLELVDVIAKNVEENENQYRKEYPELFKYVDLVRGVVVSVGNHPAATVVSPFPLEDIIGTFTTSTSDYPVTQVDMKEIDSLNFVKLDVLSLENVELINETCNLAGIERVTPDNLDVSNEKVWMSVRESSTGVFQWNSSLASQYYKQLFSDETLRKIKEKNPNLNYMDLLSIGNAALRPAGESYRYELAKGEFQDNGHEALNELLASTNGYLCYQEQVLAFLNEFCGFSMAEGDIIRRAFAKKGNTEQYIPSIKKGFIETMLSKYNICKTEAEELIESFVKVIEDSSSYLFSLNHSQSYSYIGYACAWLRYYYPLEFMTVYLNTYEDKEDKTVEGINFIKNHSDIKLKPIKFGYSGALYTMNKKENAIYQGIASLKFLNKEVGDLLYELGQRKYKDFYEVLKALSGTCINSKQLTILIGLDFFNDYGKNKTLLKCAKLYGSIWDKKQIAKSKAETLGLSDEIMQKYSRQTDKTYMEVDIESVLKETFASMPDERLSIKEQIQFETDYLGYIRFVEPKASDDYYIVSEMKVYGNKAKPYVSLYQLKTGKTIKSKVKDEKDYMANPFKLYDTLRIEEFRQSPKHSKVNGKWKKTGEMEDVMYMWQIM